jgi:hypothetical protein
MIKDDPNCERVIFCCFSPVSAQLHEQALRELQA